MAKVTVYGIKNCNTMKKAFDWLDAHDVEYDFHDYKKEGADADVLRRAIAEHGWENVINRRGMTWRKFPETVKNAMNEDSAVDAALEKPSVIKRPLVVSGDGVHLGFDEDDFSRLFG